FPSGPRASSAPPTAELAPVAAPGFPELGPVTFMGLAGHHPSTTRRAGSRHGVSGAARPGCRPRGGGSRCKLGAVGFLHGLFAPFRGLTFISRNRLWRYLLAPVMVNVALGIGAFWAMALYWRQEVAPSLSAHPVWAWIGFIGATVLSGIAIFIVLHPVLDAIFNDRLSEKVEHKIRGVVPKTPFLASSGKALAHGLLKLVLYAIAILVGFVLGIPSVGIGALV